MIPTISEESFVEFSSRQNNVGVEQIRDFGVKLKIAQAEESSLQLYKYCLSILQFHLDLNLILIRLQCT